MPYNDTTLVSEEMNEIMGAMPAWGMRWGTLLLLMVVVLFLFVSSFITWPDVISGKAVITPVTMPVDVTLPAGAVLRRTLVSDNAFVRKGQALLLTAMGDTLYAPAAGRVMLQSVAATATLVMSITPEAQRYQVTVLIPGPGSGKVALQQQVNIHLDIYPWKEFGSLTGTVISKPLSAGHYRMVSIALDHGTVTDYHKSLEIYKGVNGVAEIAVEQKSLLRRLFGFLR